MKQKNIQNESQDYFQASQGPVEEGVKINGLEQVIDLLKYADPSFRESLLKRLTSRDPQLAHRLRRIIR